jgi:hypothetical protein
MISVIDLSCFAQNSISNPGAPKEPYDRTKEIIYKFKRYRKWNNYLTGGPGFAISPQRIDNQKVGGIDFNFHLRDQYLQVGGLLSGTNLTYSKNNLQAHLGYGLRIERKKFNTAFFVGPSFSYGFFLVPDSTTSTKLSPDVYSQFGGYASAQFVYKIKYDVGIGFDLFADYNERLQLYGGKIILFFSSAYRGYLPGYKPRKPFSYNE